MRPAFVAGRLASGGIPTSVSLGAYAGYSMPIWSTPANQYEELYWRLCVPGRWDGTTDISYHINVALAAAETLNDEFKFQLSWSNTNSTTGVISDATKDVEVGAVCSTGHNAQYSVFEVTFTIDISEAPISPVAISDVLVGRIRRIASGGTEISGECIIFDHTLNFVVDRVFKA